MTLSLLLLACAPDKGSLGPDETGDSRPGETAETGETGSPDETGETGETGETDLLARVQEALAAGLSRDLRASNATGASVALWIDGEIVAFGVGSRHPDEELEVTTDTLFQIGSDTKKLTAIALLRQVEAGRLSLDDSLADALPALSFALDPSWSEPISVHDLLSHQGALYDYTPWDDAPDDSELAERTYGRFAENEFAMAAPGVFWNYCNPGFSLAGLAAQEHSEGRLYADLLKEDIFAPLGMTRSFARLSEAQGEDDYATGYGYNILGGSDTFDGLGAEVEFSLGTLEMEDQVDNGFTRPAGLIWSTGTDMIRLAQFLVDGDEDVLSDALREQITAAQVPLYPTVPFQFYGYGLMVLDGFNLGRDFYDTPLWMHGGNTLTMTSAFYVLPEQRFAIAILSNGYGDDFSNTISAALSDLAGLPEPSAGPEYEDVGDLAEYEGTWEDAYGLGEITLSYDGEDLNISIPLLEEYGYTVRAALDPVIKDLFYAYIDGAAYDLTFIDGEDGTTHKYLRNRQFVGVLADAPEARPAPPGSRPLASRAEVARRLREGRLDDPSVAARPFLPGPLGEPFRLPASDTETTR